MPTMYLRSWGPSQSQASCFTWSKTLGFAGLIPGSPACPVLARWGGSPLLRNRSLTVTSTFALPLDQPPVTLLLQIEIGSSSVVPIRQSLETTGCLLQEPLDHARVVVTEADDMVQRRKAMRLAGFFHGCELMRFKL